MTNVFQTVFDFIFRRTRQSEVLPSVSFDDPISLYDALEGMYNNDTALHDSDTTRRVRTVVNRSVEFYASKMLPGDRIGVTSEDDALTEAVQTILKSANFQAIKPSMLRSYALFGDSFIKVVAEDGEFLFQDIKPRYVTAFTEDSRGLLETIRIDLPTTNENGQSVLYTEYWDADGFKSWITFQTSSTPIDNLGQPKESLTLQELGLSQIPIVHTKFKDTGEPRGQSCVYHALDKIYEANRLATRLNDLQFRHNKPVWAVLANDKDADGRPRPAPKIKTTGGDAGTTEASKEFVFGDVTYMPGMSQLQTLVPPINFDAALNILNAQMEELEADLPELRYYALKDANLSGRAIERLLSGAVDRAMEARNNFIASMKRVVAISLTLGSYMNILPDFDDAQFDLQVDEMFGQNMEDRAAALKSLTDSGMPLASAMRIVGFSQEQIDEVVAEKEAARNSQTESLAQGLLNFNRS